MSHETQQPNAVVEDHLQRIEDEKSVSIVLAVEHGSRAWGLHNEDSDYDIKGVYVPDDLRAYVHLGNSQKAINRDFGEFEYEIWDISKFALLLKKSNEQAIDLVRSPIEYRSVIPRSEIRDFVVSEYNPIALYHDYRSIAKNNYRKYLSEHLVYDQDVYPIINETADEYEIQSPYMDGVIIVNKAAVRDNEGTVEVPVKFITDEHDPHPLGGEQPTEVKFKETQTRQTVKRNLAVLMNAMQAEFIRKSGQKMEHELPHVHIPTFIEEQAAGVVDDQWIELIWELIAMKKSGDNSEVGDLIGRDYAHQPRIIDPETHNTGDPSVDRINEFVDRLIPTTQQ